MRPEDLAPLDEKDPVHTVSFIQGPDEIPLLGGVRGILIGLLLSIPIWGLVALLWWLW